MISVLITVVNILVFIVLSTTKELYNSQTIYKLSLAAADLLVGVVVLPSYIYNIAAFFFHPLTPSKTRFVSGYEEINGTFVEINEFASNNIIQNLIGDIFSTSYINFAGSMTTMSIFQSICTLVFAGFDRFFAIYKPFLYNKNRAIRYAKIMSVVGWLSVCVIAIFPTVTSINGLSYVMHPSFLAVYTASGGISDILYLVGFLVPLMTMWAVNINVFVIIKRHSRSFQQNHSSILRQARNNEVEKRLAITLCLMVGVFTLNTMPILITVIIQLNAARFVTVLLYDILLTVQIVSIFLVLGNSFCNFFVYNARNKNFRKALKQIIKPRGRLPHYLSHRAPQFPCSVRNCWCGTG